MAFDAGSFAMRFQALFRGISMVSASARVFFQARASALSLFELALSAPVRLSAVALVGS